MFVRFLLIVLIVQPLVVAGGKIQGSEAVTIGGIQQWITFQGDDDRSPVLLFLHGGPGNSAMGYADRFTSELKKHFIVVQWDQRESGKTRTLNKSPRPLTTALFVSDAIELIKLLSGRFSNEKIYLIGHSWGGYLGLRVAAEIPEMLSAYFALSPMIFQLESERLSLQVMKDKATAENNRVAIKELGAVEIPFKNGEQLYYHRKWLSQLMRSTTPVKTKVDQWAATWLSLFNEASQTDFNVVAPELKCPVYFLIGSNDYQTHFSLVESYYQRVVCKEKKLYWFSESAHNPHLTESVKFQKIVIDIRTN